MYLEQSNTEQFTTLNADNLKVGDRIKSHQFGEVEVILIERKGNKYLDIQVKPVRTYWLTLWRGDQVTRVNHKIAV